MIQEDYQAFRELFIKIAAFFGEQRDFTPDEFERMVANAAEHETIKINSSEFVQLLTRMHDSLQTMFQGVEPQEHESYELVSRLAIEVLDHMKQIADNREVYADPLECAITKEEKLRRLVWQPPPEKKMEMPSQLWVAQLTVTRKCLLGCDYCGVDATSRGKHMPLDVFYDIVESQGIHFPDNRVHLADGEVLLRPHLDKIIRKLVYELGLGVSIVTRGLIKQNRKQALRFFEAIKDIGFFLRQELNIGLTLDPIPAHENNGEYIEKMLETIEILKRLIGPRNITLEPTYRNDDAGEVMERLQPIFDSARGIGLDGGELKACGRAVKNHQFHPIDYDIASKCSVLNEPFNFAIMRNGDITVFCGGFGYDGAILGNVFRNSHTQISTVYTQFREEHRKRSWDCPEDVDVCEHHRTWKKRFKLPQSKYPVVKRRKRAVA